jgi:hypothetical protein
MCHCVSGSLTHWHSVTSQMTWILSNTNVRTSNLILCPICLVLSWQEYKDMILKTSLFYIAATKQRGERHRRGGYAVIRCWYKIVANDTDYIICSNLVATHDFHILFCRFYKIQAHDYGALLIVFHIYLTVFNELTSNIKQCTFILKGWLQEYIAFVNKQDYIT